jgi:hypothetical protein
MFINEAKKVFEMNAAEYKAAMTYGTEEYKALRELRADYPGFRAVEMKPKKSKSPLDKLDMKTVRAYVRAHGSDTQKKEFLDIVVHHLDFVLDGSVNLVIRADGVYAVCDDGTYKITRKAKAAA